MKSNDEYFDYYTALLFLQCDAEEMSEEIRLYKVFPEEKVDLWSGYYEDIVCAIDEIYLDKLMISLGSVTQ